MEKVIVKGIKLVSFIFVSVMLLQACSALRMMNPFGQKISFVEPPKDLAFSTSDVIAIKPNGSVPGMIEQIQSTLVKANAGGQPYFKTVIVGEELAEADGLKTTIIEINVTDNQVFDTRTQETRMQCPGKKLINTCSSEEAYYYKVNCQKRTATLSATLTAVSAADSTNTLASKEANSSAESIACSDRNDSLETEGSLLRKALGEVARKLVEDYIPIHSQRPSDLIDELDNIVEADAQLLSLATELAAKSDFGKAEEIYKGLLSRYPNQAELMFNIGYVNHAQGNYALAADFYSKAMQLAGLENPNEDYATYSMEALNWINKGVVQVKR